MGAAVKIRCIALLLLLAGLFSLAGGCAVSGDPAPDATTDQKPPTSFVPSAEPTVTPTPPATIQPTDPGVTAPAPDPEPGLMEVIIYDVGKADAILIITENHVVMIDTGENRHSSQIIDDLLGRNIFEIDTLILTHFHKDHAGGAGAIIRAITVREVLVPNYGKSSGSYDRLMSALGDSGLESIVLTEKMSFTLDNVEFNVYPTLRGYHDFRVNDDDEDDYENSGLSENDFSLVIDVAHGDNYFLFAGDAIAGRLEEILATESIISRDYDFLKVPHHGRYNRMSDTFIQAIAPTYAVITDSADDQASDKVLYALIRIGAVILSTQNGDILCISDGETLTVLNKSKSPEWSA